MEEFPKEQIPDEHDLFMRIHFKHFKDGDISPIAFRNHDGGMSTNWSNYADALLTKEHAALLHNKDPNNYGVVELSVGGVRDIPNQEVDHDPLPDNRAHTNVLGEKDEEARLKLNELSNWAIPINRPS